MGVDQLIIREALNSAGFSKRQVFTLCVIFAFIWSVGGYIFGKVEILDKVHLKIVKQTVKKKELKKINRERLAADKKIIEATLNVAENIDKDYYPFKKKMLRQKRLPANNFSEPLRQLKNTIK